MKNSRDPFRKVGLIANTEKPGARSVVQRAAELIRRSGREVVCEAETAAMSKFQGDLRPSAVGLARDVDLLIVFGGDGTMLRVAREIGGLATPILGVNIGGLGFLTAVSSHALAGALEKVWTGGFRLEERPLIEAHGTARGKNIAQAALNDFVISRGLVSRLIELEVAVDGQNLTRYRCDGLIVSSPTGSTAYSLAAGGAIVHPGAEVFTITPICPHTLSNRSVIVGLSSILQVRVASKRLEPVLSADGQIVTELSTGDTVVIRRSRRKVRLLQLNDTSFFETLQIKLHWSGSNV